MILGGGGDAFENLAQSLKQSPKYFCNVAVNSTVEQSVACCCDVLAVGKNLALLYCSCAC